jgi:hypothetical protein
VIWRGEGKSRDVDSGIGEGDVETQVNSHAFLKWREYDLEFRDPHKSRGDDM